MAARIGKMWTIDLQIKQPGKLKLEENWEYKTGET